MLKRLSDFEAPRCINNPEAMIKIDDVLTWYRNQPYILSSKVSCFIQFSELTAERDAKAA